MFLANSNFKMKGNSSQTSNYCDKVMGGFYDFTQDNNLKQKLHWLFKKNFALVQRGLLASVGPLD